jgi:LysM repeat protein
LAQGIHETSAGQSDLVLKSNNHFGIKCKAEWQGESVYHDDDARGECFRKYNDPADSYKDHSDFLKTRKHYAFLFTLDPLDYEGWAWGLKKAGYATNPKYPQILIKLINDYHLQDYTLIALGNKQAEPAEVFASNTINQTTEAVEKAAPVAVAAPVYPQGVFKINETEVVFVPKGTSYLAIAEQYHLSLSRLFEFNDLPQAEAAPADGLIFLHRKRKRGAHDFYTVTGTETLHQIAQAEGIRLESLLEYNFLKAGMQPATGALLYLQGKAPAAPKLAAPKRVSTASAFDKMPEELSQDDAYIVHTVQPKETVYAISKKYAVTADDILKWNNLETPYLKTGQQLRINKKGSNAAN